MHPKHIRDYYKEGKRTLENVDDNLYKLLSRQPNEIQNAYKFYYQVISDLELNNKFSLSLVLYVDLLALYDDLEG